MIKSRSIVTSVTAGLLVLSAGLTALAAAPGGPLVQYLPVATPKPTPPSGPATSAEFDALVASAQQRHVEYLREFISSGHDPRALPRITISATAPRLATLEAAVAEADVIIRGRVESISFRPGTSGVPVATATIRMSEWIKGISPEEDAVTVRQIGGPVPQPSGGGLAQLETDELILPGDDVFLFLTSRLETAPDYQTIPTAGIYFVHPAGLVGQGVNPFGASVNGMRATAFSARLRSLAD